MVLSHDATALCAAGVTEDQVDQTLVRNPRAIFEASGV